MKKLRIAFALICIASISTVSRAQVSVTGTSTYTQNFDTLITSSSATWADDSTITGWYAQRTGSGTTIVAGTGSSTTGALYSFGTGTETDRALGSLGSSNAAAGHFVYGVTFQNSSGGSLNLGNLSYVGEQWRNGGTAAQTVTVWYKISATDVTSFTPNVDTGWTALGTLNFTSPITMGTASALNGNSSANRVSLTTSLSSITLTSGQFFAVRFSDPDHSGADHGLSIDDFSLAFTAIPEPSTYAAIFGALALAGVVVHRRRQARR